MIKKIHTIVKIRVITHPGQIKNETCVIQALFDAGLECLHLRKPNAPKADIERLLNMLPDSVHPRIIVHAHADLVGKYNVGGIHFPEQYRKQLSDEEIRRWADRMQAHGKTVGTSVHDQKTLLTLPLDFDYVMVSPVFESISKVEYRPQELWNVRKLKTQVPFTLVGLGGITPERIAEAAQLGFTEVAVLGTIWNEPEKAVRQYMALQPATSRKISIAKKIH